jgi:hypothetical protein
LWDAAAVPSDHTLLLYTDGLIETDLDDLHDRLSAHRFLGRKSS